MGNKINSNLAELFKIVSYTAEYTVGSGNTVWLTYNNFGISAPSGYTPIALARATTGSNVVLLQAFYGNAASGSILICRNISNASVTATAAVSVIYVRSGVI